MEDTKRLISYMIKAKNSNKKYEDLAILDGYLIDEEVERQGFFICKDESDEINLIPKENVIQFSLGYSLIEYANMNGYTLGHTRPDALNMRTYVSYIGERRPITIDDCISVNSGDDYVSFDRFSMRAGIEKVFIAKERISNIVVKVNEEASQYKPSLLFDKDLLPAAAGEGNTDKVMEIFDSLAKVDITQSEILELYKKGYYNTENLPEGIKFGLDAMASEETEFVGKDDNIVEFPSGEVEEENIKYPTQEDFDEIERFAKSLADNNEGLLKEIEEEYDEDLAMLQSMNKDEFFKNLDLAREYENNGADETPTVLLLEASFAEALGDRDTDEELDVNSDEFKEKFYEFVLSL